MSARFETMPKVELHLHIDCSLSHRVVAALGREIDEESFARTFTAPARCASLKQYLDAIAPSAALLQSPDALRVATCELIRDLAADGLVYVELRFAPQRHLAGGHTLGEIVEGVLAGVREADAFAKGRIGIVLCALRDDPTEVGLQLVDLAVEYRARGVVGLDLAGYEAGWPLAPQIPVFVEARRRKLNVTAHAGEALGSESVMETLTELGVRRIGHGVRSIESDAAVERIKSLGVHLEVCPSSNIQVGVFDALELHPVDALARRGVSLGINTDARTVARLTLTEEYRRLAATFGWTADDFLACNLQAIAAAFLPEPARERLRADFLDAWTRWAAND